MSNKTPTIPSTDTTAQTSAETSRQVGILSKGLQSIVDMTKTKKNFKLTVESEVKLQAISKTIAGFVAVDVNFDGGCKAVGKICKAILDSDETIQRRVIQSIAVANGLDPFEDVGRAGLIKAMFGRYPDMFKVSGKDTLAGKRLSWYLISAKPTLPPNRVPPRQITGATETPEGATEELPEETPVDGVADLFTRLYNACKTAVEQRFLLNIAGRAGIEYEDWLKDASPDSDGSVEEETATKPTKPTKPAKKGKTKK